jgi:hypothetical protein
MTTQLDKARTAFGLGTGAEWALVIVALIALIHFW